MQRRNLINYETGRGREAPLRNAASAPIVAYVPLCAAILQIPWAGLIGIAAGFMMVSRDEVQIFIGWVTLLLPAGVGLLFGLHTIIWRWPANPVDRFFAVFGSTICALLAAYFIGGGNL